MLFLAYLLLRILVDAKIFLNDKYDLLGKNGGIERLRSAFGDEQFHNVVAELSALPDKHGIFSEMAIERKDFIKRLKKDVAEQTNNKIASILAQDLRFFAVAQSFNPLNITKYILFFLSVGAISSNILSYDL